jgi:hypothetical protein
MNRLRKISSLLFVIAMCLPLACETEKKIFEGPYFVRFTDVSVVEKESHSSVLEVQVHNGGPAPKGDLTIDYTIAGSAREGIDYVIKGVRGKVKIKSGEYFGNIEIQLINNSNNILRSQDIVLSLQSIENNNELLVGQGPSDIGKTCTITIQDDCILGGDYYGVIEEGDAPVEGITISSLDCEEYTLSNWEIDPYSLTERDLTFIDNGDNTLTIPPQEETTLNPDSATIDGFGVVDPVTRKISFTVRLADYKAQPEFSFQLIPN